MVLIICGLRLMDLRTHRRVRGELAAKIAALQFGNDLGAAINSK